MRERPLQPELDETINHRGHDFAFRGDEWFTQRDASPQANRTAPLQSLREPFRRFFLLLADPMSSVELDQRRTVSKVHDGPMSAKCRGRRDQLEITPGR